MYDGILKKSIFSFKSEVINLLFPLTFFVLILLEYFYNVNYFRNLSRLENSFLGNIIFLNITHNAFTIILLTSTMPLQKWIEKLNERINEVLISKPIFFTEVFVF